MAGRRAPVHYADSSDFEREIRLSAGRADRRSARRRVFGKRESNVAMNLVFWKKANRMDAERNSCDHLFSWKI